ncbi:MAG: hypothetical protein LBU06_07250 [Desulfovibrio sp.]|jgi:hypothetical protein|nr:hypothetical protein [Desulfovibrio sp.]
MADVFAEDLQMVAVAGRDGHLGKPIEYSKVMDLIGQSLRRSALPLNADASCGR